jgi:hypothetical protein
MPGHAAVDRVAVELEALDVRGQEAQALLELGAREVRAQAVVDAGAEGRQRPPSVRVMSKRSGSSSPSRLAVQAATSTTVPAGKATSRTSMSSTTMRAVNGVIGS